MRFKAFKLNKGKLEFTGMREIQEGDAILEGETSMTEVSLTEASTSDFPGLFSAGPTRDELEKARAALAEEKRQTLRNSFKRLKPDATDRELDIMVSGKVPQEKKQGII